MKERVEISFKDSLNGRSQEAFGVLRAHDVGSAVTGLLFPVPCSVGQ